VHTSKLEALKNLPYLVHWNTGKIEHVFLAEGEDLSMVNLKKGVASLFQVSDCLMSAKATCNTWRSVGYWSDASWILNLGSIRMWVVILILWLLYSHKIWLFYPLDRRSLVYSRYGGEEKNFQCSCHESNPCALRVDKILTVWEWGSHGGEDDIFVPLGFDAVQTHR
jgi:hypothetical protein